MPLNYGLGLQSQPVCLDVWPEIAEAVLNHQLGYDLLPTCSSCLRWAELETSKFTVGKTEASWWQLSTWICLPHVSPAVGFTRYFVACSSNISPKLSSQSTAGLRSGCTQRLCHLISAFCRAVCLKLFRPSLNSWLTLKRRLDWGPPEFFLSLTDVVWVGRFPHKSSVN